MESILELIKSPWPWYIGGALIGLMVPLLLFFANKQFGISSTLSNICAACIPIKGKYQFDWKKGKWNMTIALGIVAGSYIAANFLRTDGFHIDISEDTIADLQLIGVHSSKELFAPTEIFSWESLFSFKGIIFIVLGGFLVGFGTRYAGGCTSGHAIMGLSLFNLGSLVAVIGFFVGGLIVTHLLLPYLIN